MLHRSTSSRRRRASRSTASSPSQPRTPRSTATSPGRRASIAVSPVDGTRGLLQPEINRSPRHSIIPDISLEDREASFDENNSSIGPCNYSLLPDAVLSPRNSLVPDSNRSPRHSLVPADYSRSPRNSLIPDSALSPRNSLVPTDNYNRSPRNSLVPSDLKSPRNSLVPDSNRSPRHSLVPDNNVYGSRISLSPDFNRSPRNSLAPDSGRTPRQTLTPSESCTWNQNGASPQEESRGEGMGVSRSPRHSIAPISEGNRSPRGSIAPETLNVRTSPRGSVGSDYHSDRSPRGSIGPENNNHNRSPRGSLARNTLAAEDSGRSPRGSLTLTFQEPPVTERRSSADNPSCSRAGGRSTSPYRTSSRGAINMGYTSNTGLSEGGSRRASSSVSQVSGDEQKRLCAEQKYDGEQGLGLGISLTTYGSVAYQLKDANLEANSTCDFVVKAMNIVNKTIVVTIILICLSTLPILMMIMGVQFLRDCPREPHIPVYMVVGGSVGCIKMAWILWDQLHVRRIESSNGPSIGARVASFALTLFLIVWFSLGNYWIFSIKWPDYSPSLFDPNRWCHRTLYVFSIVHLFVIYSVFVCMFILVIFLTACQLFGCPWLGPTRFK